MRSQSESPLFTESPFVSSVLFVVYICSYFANHEVHEEREDYTKKKVIHRTYRLIPFFSCVTLKLINRPVLIPASFIYVSSCASWTCWMCSTLLSSTISLSSTSKSTLYPQSRTTPLYSTGTGCSDTETMLLHCNSRTKHRRYVDSSSPGPSSRCTSMAQPITCFDNGSNSILRVSSCLFVVHNLYKTAAMVLLGMLSPALFVAIMRYSQSLPRS